MKLRTALVTRPHTQLLKDGSIRPGAFELEFEEVPVIIQAFRRMVRGLEFDVSEMAMTTYMCARAHGTRFTAIPVFPMRAFHHGAILVNTESGIQSPKDLEGKRVGVNRGYTVTTGVWARAILQHEYGLDLSRVTWVLSGDEHVREWVPPPNVVPLAAGKTLDAMLVSGEIPAAIGVQVESRHVKPLISRAADAGLEALRTRGLYPINHTVVVRDELLDAHPTLATDLFHAFAAAKRPYVQRLASDRSGALPAEDAFFTRVMDLIGDPLPYGIEPNRRMLEAIVQHAADQGILTDHLAVEELFPPATHALAA